MRRRAIDPRTFSPTACARGNGVGKHALALSLLASAAVPPHAAFAADASSTNPLESAACMPLARAESFLSDHQGTIRMQLRGESLEDRGKNLDLDTGKASIPFSLAFYRVDGDDAWAVRWSILKPDASSAAGVSSVCSVVWGTNHHLDAVANIGSGFPTRDVANPLMEQPEDVQRACKDLRPRVAAVLAATLEDIGGRPVRHDVADASRDRAGTARKLETAVTAGDARCDTYSRMLAGSRPDGERVIAALFMTRSQYIGQYGSIAVLMSPVRRWQILMTVQGGATVRFAQGKGVTVPSTDHPLVLIDQAKSTNAISSPARPEDPAAIMALLERLAEQGDAAAQATLGTMYFDGQGVKLDHQKALFWNTKAAAQGRPDAMLHLGLAYQQLDYQMLGDPPMDAETANYWFAKAAETAKPLSDKGDAIGEYVVGTLMYNNLALGNYPGSEIHAARLLTQSAQQGYAPAEVFAGQAEVYAKSRMEWFGKAALQGSSSGMDALARAYEGQGDAEKAKLWFSRAALLGDVQSSRELLSTYKMRVGDAKMEYVYGGALNKHGADIHGKLDADRSGSDPGHSTLQTVTAILAASAALGLMTAGSDPHDAFWQAEQQRNEEWQWEADAAQAESDHQVNCLLAGDDKMLQDFAGGC